MIKLHIGCGKRNFGFDWIHIDGEKHPHVGIAGYNITKLPFNNGIVGLIYASHVIEYFDGEEVKDVLKEWYRVLKPKGILRLAVPDFEAMAKLYLDEGYSLSTFIGPLYGKMQMGEKTIYHKTVYDELSLCRVLAQCGFDDKTYRIYDWRKTEHAQFDDHSQAYIPHMDKEKGTLISLNVEIQKP